MPVLLRRLLPLHGVPALPPQLLRPLRPPAEGSSILRTKTRTDLVLLSTSVGKLSLSRSRFMLDGATLSPTTTLQDLYSTSTHERCVSCVCRDS